MATNKVPELNNHDVQFTRTINVTGAMTSDVSPTPNVGLGGATVRIPLTLGRNDDGGSLVATSPGATDFTVANTTGTSTGLAGHASTNNTKTDKAVFEARLPSFYKAGDDVTVGANAKYTTTGGTAGATVDIEAFKMADAGTHGSDLCATSAQALGTNSATKSFTITGTTLGADDRLLLRVTTATTTPTGATASATVNSLGLT
jgi:hypothetical protein